MPSELPKVTVYLKPETRAALDAASAALGQSRSKLVAELLDAAIPVFEAMTDAAKVLANVGDMQREALAGLASNLEPLTGDAEQLLARFVEATTEATAKAGGPEVEAGGPDPRASNRGVRI
jgi:ABC-type transporter Mla subunit MlaD